MIGGESNSTLYKYSTLFVYLINEKHLYGTAHTLLDTTEGTIKGGYYLCLEKGEFCETVAS